MQFGNQPIDNQFFGLAKTLASQVLASKQAGSFFLNSIVMQYTPSVQK
jgi:hypothetical protein